ncbi:MAG: DNA-processing protein DprA [Lachnospiraceae bacterium]|nr:DNA-processing protein DprA [Lachnospiraceae bacterium]
MSTDREMICWLNSIEGLGKSAMHVLCKRLGEHAAEQLYGMSEEQIRILLTECFGEGNKTQRLMESVLKAGRRDPAGMYARMLEQGIQMVVEEDEAYPARLRTIPDPPGVLYVLGRLPDQEKPALAIVGARDASPYGREQARRFARELSMAGVQIISGMARGVDGIAGRAALSGSGCSFAVLGCGVDICYPPENRDLYDELKKQGGLISEYRPGTEPKSGLFPLRNRIISGLCDVLLVTEARLRSGTLITADAALEQGREVYAIPGRISDSFSMGCNQLICQGAQAAVSPEQLLEFFYGVRGEAPEEAQLERAKCVSIRKSLPQEEGILYELLNESELRHSRDLLEALSGELHHPVSAGELKRLLMKLILKGYAAEEGTGWYRRAR